MDLARLLAARRKEKESLKKKPDAYKKVFSEYERNALASVDSSRESQKYRDIFLGKPMSHSQIGEPVNYDKSKPGNMGEDAHSQRAMQRQAENAGPGRYTGPSREYAGDKSYIDNLIDESDRWKKTGSRWVMPTTKASRRDTHMGKMYNGIMSTMTGVLGGALIKKKKLLGK